MEGTDEDRTTDRPDHPAGGPAGHGGDSSSLGVRSEADALTDADADEPEFVPLRQRYPEAFAVSHFRITDADIAEPHDVIPDRFAFADVVVPVAHLQFLLSEPIVHIADAYVVEPDDD